MSFNEKLPEWNNAGVEPPQSKKDEGFNPGEKPPAQWFNWLLNRIYKSIQELREKAVIKVAGKDLSSNDYTNEDKDKLAGIDANAQVNNISNTNATDLTDGGETSLHYHSSDRNRSNHSGTQTAATISDFSATVRSTVLSGLSTATNAVITATDSVLSALGKIQKQITDYKNLKGVPNGLAELDSAGKVPSSQLPSYVDDVLEYSSKSGFPAIGETGKIYVAIDVNLTYRWSGSGYVEISPSIALGETSSTAYRGDRGKTAYDHSQVAHDKNLVGLNNVINVEQASKQDFVAHLAEYAIQVASGTANVITINTGGNFKYTQGNRVSFKAILNSTSTVTINVDGKGAKTLKKIDGSNATLKTGKVYEIYYDVSGNCFFLLARAEGNAVAGDVLAGKTFSNDDDTGTIGTMLPGVKIKSLQRGVASILDSGSEVTINVNPVNTSKAVLLITHTGDSYNSRSYVQGKIIDSTSIKMQRYAGYRTIKVSWELIEFENISIQSGEYILEGLIGSTNINPVNTSKSFVLYSLMDYRSSEMPSTALTMIYLSDSTTIAFERNNSTSSRLYFSWYVLSFN